MADLTIQADSNARNAAGHLARRAKADGYVPEALHVYDDNTGNPYYWRIRAKHPNGDKWIRPMYYDGQQYQLGEPAFDNGKPLYALSRLSSHLDSDVWVTEGEKAADALLKAGRLATTSGAADSAGTANWSSLKGRNVVLWPDNDEAGAKYLRDVLAQLWAAGVASVHIVDVPMLELPDKADAFDWLQQHQPDELEHLPMIEASQPHVITGPTVGIIKASTIKPEPIRWLWDGWLARGKLHILAGAPGTGKTTISMAMAATVTTGGRWPDGSLCPAGNVLIWSGEDDPTDTLVPRLLAAGANIERVFFVGETQHQPGETRPFDPAHDLAALQRALTFAGNVRLMIVDPVVSAVAGDGHKSNDVRRALQPLVDMAASLDCAMLGVSHFSKGTGGKDPVERVTGSVAFSAVARVVLATAKTQNQDGDRAQVLARAKSNIGPDHGGFIYHFEQCELEQVKGVIASRIQWGEPLEGSARDLLASDEGGESEGQSETRNAANWLQDVLAVGPMKSKEVKLLGERNGFSIRTIERAKQRLGVESEREGYGKDTTVWWRLPLASVPPTSASPAKQKTLAELGIAGGTDENGSEPIATQPESYAASEHEEF